LSPRMMESYEKKPYCRAHRPDAKATATTVKGDFKTNQAVSMYTPFCSQICLHIRLSVVFSCPKGCAQTTRR
jgi:hypothetical protein